MKIIYTYIYGYTYIYYIYRKMFLLVVKTLIYIFCSCRGIIFKVLYASLSQQVPQAASSDRRPLDLRSVTSSDSFLNQLTDSLSFLFRTTFVADISLLARIPAASEDRLTADIDPTSPLT
jgi:hypothetical protein